MATTVGTGALTFEFVDNWAKIPDDWHLVDVAGVAVDSKDNVFLFNRGEHPIIVLDSEGNLLRTWGEGTFSARPHGLHIAPDDSVFCIDDGFHVVRKYDAEGKLLMTLGTDQQASHQVGRRALQPPHSLRGVRQDWQHLRLRRLRQRPGPQVRPRRPPPPFLG